MNDRELNKKLLDIMEYGMGPEVMPGAMPGAVPMPSEEPKVDGSVEFKQHKNTDKGSVSIEATGDTLQDLADVLKLAGLTLPDAMKPAEKPAEKPEDEPCDDCADDGEKEDPSYTTNKQAIIDRLRDTLKAKLIR